MSGLRKRKVPGMPRITLVCLVGVCAVLHAGATAQAQAYPTKVIKMIVPAGPGGPTDVLARLVADRMAAALGQPVIIDNRGGGGGAIGAKAVAAADPDGYTLLFGNTATLANIPAISKSAGYDSARNFAGVAKVMDSYQVLVVSPNLPVKSVAELTAYAQGQPGQAQLRRRWTDQPHQSRGRALQAQGRARFRGRAFQERRGIADLRRRRSVPAHHRQRHRRARADGRRQTAPAGGHQRSAAKRPPQPADHDR